MQAENATRERQGVVRWRSPVALTLRGRAREKVHSPGQALDKLLHEWPRVRGRHYLSARTSCKAAMESKIDPELAREAFIRATAEAALLSEH
jgi:hypothetical protein